MSITTQELYERAAALARSIGGFCSLIGESAEAVERCHLQSVGMGGCHCVRDVVAGKTPQVPPAPKFWL